jgi:hypothetical protein
MQITDILAQMGGLKSMANELGVSEDEARTGAAALIPAILGGMKKQAQASPDGIEGLGGLLSQLGGGGLLENVLSPQPTDVSQGNDVLGEIFGSKQVSRTVAENAAQNTGLEPSLLKKMLPMLAMAVAGYLANQHFGGGGASARGDTQPSSGGGMLGGILDGLRGQQAPGRGGLGGLASMIDANGDGNVLDDIMGMAGKVLRR